MLVMNVCIAMLSCWVPGGMFAARAQPAPPDLASIEAPRGETTATIDLGVEFAPMKGYILTQGIETLPPGTGRHWHRHVSQPEIIRVLTGVLTEARNGQPAKQYRAGSTLTNPTGTYHSWANLGSEPCVFIATVIKKTAS